MPEAELTPAPTSPPARQAGPEPRIVVAGDIAVDWLQWPMKPACLGTCEDERHPNWRLYTGFREAAEPGGALLLAQMVGDATGLPVARPRTRRLDRIPAEKILRSASVLKEYPLSSARKDEGKKVYRIEQFRGFCGPKLANPAPPAVQGDSPHAELVVLDDAGNGFRDCPAAWPQAFAAPEGSPLVVLKMSRPLTRSALLAEAVRRHGQRLVVVVRADDLREAGVDISRRLSWERTAQDLLWQLQLNSELDELKHCAHLVVRFGLEGALHTQWRGDGVEAALLYDPGAIEEDYDQRYPGKMQGLASAFVAALAAGLVGKTLAPEAIGQGIRNGLRAARRLLLRGFGGVTGDPSYPRQGIFVPSGEADPFLADVSVPDPGPTGPACGHFWTILDEVTRDRLEGVARNVVERGREKDKSLSKVPVGCFGEMRTLDRAEIEGLQMIRNLMAEYLLNPKPKNPLCIAVFGPPGSGKSFAVTQVAESIAKDRVEEITFNVAEFTSPQALAPAFHRVRDIALKGKVPLVFFDEFDSRLDGRKLGWLKYFLAPMQDGEFREGEAVHPIGKAIFVFAGGTSHSFQRFRGEGAQKGFRNAKGPDFLSRLRGYVNIVGANEASRTDSLVLIRRAAFLRHILEKNAPQVFDSSGKALIDRGVLDAMLKVREYRHGVRSMLAIVQMSLLAGRRCFERADLPPAEQLELHVDARAFSRLALRHILFEGRIEDIARELHNRYLPPMQGERPADDPTMQPWDKLPELYKESNRQVADQIPEKLQSIGCSFRPAGEGAPPPFQLADREIERLAQMEHERYVEERKRAGWVYGPERDEEKRTHPCIVPWDKLPEKEKEKDIASARAIPELLAKAGFGVCRVT
ncbi:MAG TPA: RyR domain-containing protein [Planctomycetota bacterium]|nr:RyR domain-containing protein [Planctomycetota bacterium]